MVEKTCRKVWEVSLPTPKEKSHPIYLHIDASADVSYCRNAFLVPPLRSQNLAGSITSAAKYLFVILLVNHMSHPSPLTTMGRLTFAVSSQGALDFVEELQVRESDWEVADRHGCVVWVATQCAMMIPVPRRHESDACRAGAWA